MVFHSWRISNSMSVLYDKASIFLPFVSSDIAFAKLYKYFPLTPQIHAMSSHKIPCQLSLDWHIQQYQEARGIRQKPGVNLQTFILPFLIHPNAHFYKTGKNIITFETSASLSKLAENGYWVQELLRVRREAYGQKKGSFQACFHGKSRYKCSGEKCGLTQSTAWMRRAGNEPASLQQRKLSRLLRKR